ncbi:hypothetical protein Bca101_046285 [Brassica carinata]
MKLFPGKYWRGDQHYSLASFLSHVRNSHNSSQEYGHYCMRGDALCSWQTGSELTVFCFGFVSGECQDQDTDKDKEDNGDNTRYYAANTPSWFTLRLGHDQTFFFFLN